MAADWKASHVTCKYMRSSRGPFKLQSFRKQVDLFLGSDSGSRFRRCRRELVLYSVRFSSEQRAGLEAGGYICQDILDFQRILGPGEPTSTSGSKRVLCELASLFVLHQLADGWKERPPPCLFEAEAFAPNFRTYAEEIEQGHRQPVEGDFQAWLTDNLDRLEEEPCIRELNRTLAIALLDRFIEDPSLWRDCGQLNCWDANANETFESYLVAWAEQLKMQGKNSRVPYLVEGLFLSAQGTMRN